MARRREPNSSKKPRAILRTPSGRDPLADAIERIQRDRIRLLRVAFAAIGALQDAAFDPAISENRRRVMLARVRSLTNATRDDR